MLRAQEGNIKRINACSGFAVEKVSAGADGELPTSIPGGNDRLPQALAAALDGGCDRRRSHRTHGRRTMPKPYRSFL